MATTVTDTGPRQTLRVAMNATAGNATKVTIPGRYRRFTVRFLQTDDATNDSGKLAWSGTDGAAIGNNFTPIASGDKEEFKAFQGRARANGSYDVYLAAGTNSAYAHLDLYAE